VAPKKIRLHKNRVCVCVLLGELCEVDINECVSDPCPPESICFNFDGGYACNCSDPALCPSLYTNFVPTTWGVSWEEVVGITGESVTSMHPCVSLSLSLKLCQSISQPAVTNYKP